METVKKLDRWAIAVSVAVLLVVVGLRFAPAPDAQNLPAFISYLPALHALLNSLTAVTLCVSLYFIKNKNIEAHRYANYTAMVLSATFLVSYVVYHLCTEAVLFGDADHNHIVDAAEKAAVGSMRLVYLLLLLTHIVLAAIILPFILFTFIRGYTMQVEAHKRIARYTFPLWLYVAITGPLCYFMLAPYY